MEFSADVSLVAGLAISRALFAQGQVGVCAQYLMHMQDDGVILEAATKQPVQWGCSFFELANCSDIQSLHSTALPPLHTHDQGTHH